MQNEWKQQFKDKMDGFAEPAPEGLWTDIESSLDGAQKKKEKRIIVVLSSLTAAAAAILIAVLGPGSHNNPAAEKFVDNIETIIPASTIVPQVVDSQNLDRHTIEKYSGNQKSTGRQNSDRKTDVQQVNKQYSIDQQTVERQTIERQNINHLTNNQQVNKQHPINRQSIEKTTEKTSKLPLKKDSTKETDSNLERDWNEILFAQAVEDAKRRNTSDVDLSLFASTIGSGKNESLGYDSYATAMSVSEPMLYGKSYLADIMMFNRTKDVSTNSKHFLPVRTGVTVSWQFAPRWSLQTGLTYAWLLSKFKTGSESYYYTARQNLHYIGIPLNIKFNIWNSNVFEVYASAGGMMEKCVGGSLDKEYFYGGKFGSKESNRLCVKPLQWSVSINAGVQANITKLLAVYAEPGAIYYFRNSSPIETAFSENPFNFNFSLGFRFNL